MTAADPRLLGVHNLRHGRPAELPPGSGPELSERALILAPHGRDAAVAAAILHDAGTTAHACLTVSALVEELQAGAGFAIVTEEALHTADLHGLAAWIAAQPGWSDFPFLLLTSRGGLERNPAAGRLSGVLGNVSFLERPFHPTTLVSLARSALRGRRRQYEARSRLDALHDLATHLETRVEAVVAERQQALAQLHESQKLDTLGQLTGGVAHDFNNLLTPVIGALDLLRRRIHDERMARLIDGAMQSAERAKTLVQRLLAFARRQTLQPRAVDPRQLVEGMADLLRRSLGPGIALRLDLPPELPAALVDPNQLELALLNLAVNARDAMPEGGTLEIVARHDSGAPRRPSALGAGDYVRLSVTDTGTGMDSATLARAVEPFFSTKEVGRGTGLGLSMVHGLAAQSGGAFDLRSRPGHGTTGTLWLPVAGSPAQATLATCAHAPRAPRAATVLLVDDEELVRLGTAEGLRELGYTVVEANSASAALSQLRDGLRPDAVVTDHAMPGMTGADLARELRAELPGTPVLMITGYANLSADQLPGLDVLAKPFRHADLATRVAAMLTG